MSAVAIRAAEILRRIARPNVVGAEIGVWRGDLSELLLDRPDVTLHMIDNWLPTEAQPERYRASMSKSALRSRAQQEAYRLEALERVRPYRHRAHVWQESSLEAAERFSTGELDFAFIDADHTYEAVAEDVRAWWPKIAPGGILCGHDYEYPNYPQWGVKRAVDEFAAEIGLPVELGADYTWFIRKPGEYVHDPALERAHLLNVVLLEVGNYCGRGKEYVEIMRDMVSRNLDLPHRFIVFSDQQHDGCEVRPLPPGLKGWWNKLPMFGELTQGRFLYLDLDQIITGPLDPIVRALRGRSFAAISDPCFPQIWTSSVMYWEGDHSRLWREWDGRMPETASGRLARMDLEYLNRVYPAVDRITVLCPDRIHAFANEGFRYQWPYDSTSIVVCYGEAWRPHKLADPANSHHTPWVAEIWKVGGLARPRIVVGQANVPNRDILEHVAVNQARGLPCVDRAEEPHDRIAVIVGGGPSLRVTPLPKGEIWALNGAYRYLLEQGVVPHAVVVADARRVTAAHLDLEHPESVRFYIASQCHPEVFERAGETVVLWNALHDGVAGPLLINGGSTVALSAMALLFVLGYRKLHLVGVDSSFAGGDHHAYPQPINDGDEAIDVFVAGRSFRAAKWMVAQVEEFQELAQILVSNGCEIVVHGDGLLPFVARQMAAQQAAMQKTVEEREREKYEAIWRVDRYRKVSPGLDEVEIAAAELGVRPGDSVADFGCGTGRAVRWLRDRGIEAVGIDIAGNAIEEDVPFIQAALWEAEKLPAVDYGFCVDVLEHIPPEKVDDTLRAIQKACRRACYLDIDTQPDSFGAWIGQPLHLTVEPAEWWQQKLEEIWGRVRRLRPYDPRQAVFVCTNEEA